MKNYKYIFALVAILLAASACDEEEILREEPLDFLSPTNAYTAPEHFESAIYEVYNKFRSYLGDNTSSGNRFTYFIWATDVAHAGRNPETDGLGNQALVNPQAGFVAERWESAYKIIFDANVILGRIGEVEFPDAAAKNAIIGEAQFFRALAYRFLGHLYGGVPLILEESTSPKRDFTRATRQAVYEQCRTDLQDAINNLPVIADVAAEGRISKAAAYHLLSEIQISLGDFSGAIASASAVIDDPNFALMTSRFGSRSTEPGDVYWDLFRLNNQNRSSGNTEGLWVIQVEYNTPGGHGEPNGEARFYERTLGPQYNRISGSDGQFLFFGPTTYHGGRGQGYIRPTNYYLHELWQGNWNNDIRNSNHNILRKWKIDNASSVHFGDTLDLNDPAYKDKLLGADIRKDTLQYIYPFILKVSMINNHYESEFKDMATGELAGSARRTYLDWYGFRLAETYLLRAEAYLGEGMTNEAADDINTVRARSNASLITPADVDIDYILDERARELFMEEPRRVTLARLGLLVPRVQAHNPFAGATIQAHQNLLPIPFGDIERNTLAELAQNQGYN